MSKPVCRKATSVLCMEAIEPSLVFWRDRLGLVVTAEVPGPQGLQFASLGNEHIEIMLQAAASIQDDAHSNISWRGDRSYVFIEVEDIDAVVEAMAGSDVAKPRHETFYGTVEIVYREPGGHFVTFAQHRG